MSCKTDEERSFIEAQLELKLGKETMRMFLASINEQENRDNGLNGANKLSEYRTKCAHPTLTQKEQSSQKITKLSQELNEPINTVSEKSKQDLKGLKSVDDEEWQQGSSEEISTDFSTTTTNSDDLSSENDFDSKNNYRMFKQNVQAAKLKNQRKSGKVQRKSNSETSDSDDGTITGLEEEEDISWNETSDSMSEGEMSDRQTTSDSLNSEKSTISSKKRYHCKDKEKSPPKKRMKTRATKPVKELPKKRKPRRTSHDQLKEDFNNMYMRDDIVNLPVNEPRRCAKNKKYTYDDPLTDSEECTEKEAAKTIDYESSVHVTTELPQNENETEAPFVAEVTLEKLVMEPASVTASVNVRKNKSQKIKLKKPKRIQKAVYKIDQNEGDSDEWVDIDDVPSSESEKEEVLNESFLSEPEIIEPVHDVVDLLNDSMEEILNKEIEKPSGDSDGWESDVSQQKNIHRKKNLRGMKKNRKTIATIAKNKFKEIYQPLKVELIEAPTVDPIVINILSDDEDLTEVNVQEKRPIAIFKLVKENPIENLQEVKIAARPAPFSKTISHTDKDKAQELLKQCRPLTVVVEKLCLNPESRFLKATKIVNSENNVEMTTQDGAKRRRIQQHEFVSTMGFKIIKCTGSEMRVSYKCRTIKDDQECGHVVESSSDFLIHISINHSEVGWDGFCEICNENLMGKASGQNQEFHHLEEHVMEEFKKKSVRARSQKNENSKEKNCSALKESKSRCKQIPSFDNKNAIPSIKLINDVDHYVENFDVNDLVASKDNKIIVERPHAQNELKVSEESNSKRTDHPSNTKNKGIIIISVENLNEPLEIPLLKENSPEALTPSEFQKALDPKKVLIKSVPQLTKIHEKNCDLENPPADINFKRGMQTPVKSLKSPIRTPRKSPSRNKIIHVPSMDIRKYFPKESAQSLFNLNATTEYQVEQTVVGEKSDNKEQTDDSDDDVIFVEKTVGEFSSRPVLKQKDHNLIEMKIENQRSFTLSNRADQGELPVTSKDLEIFNEPPLDIPNVELKGDSENLPTSMDTNILHDLLITQTVPDPIETPKSLPRPTLTIKSRNELFSNPEASESWQSLPNAANNLKYANVMAISTKLCSSSLDERYLNNYNQSASVNSQVNSTLVQNHQVQQTNHSQIMGQHAPLNIQINAQRTQVETVEENMNGQVLLIQVPSNETPPSCIQINQRHFFLTNYPNHSQNPRPHLQHTMPANNQTPPAILTNTASNQLSQLAALNQQPTNNVCPRTHTIVDGRFAHTLLPSYNGTSPIDRTKPYLVDKIFFNSAHHSMPPTPRPQNIAQVPSTSFATHSMADTLHPWLSEYKVKKAPSTLLEIKHNSPNYWEPKFKCMQNNCSFRSTMSSTFKEHLLSHERSGLANNLSFLQCCYCYFAGETVEQLVNHLTVEHKYDNYQCSCCYYRSATEKCLNYHMSFYHPTETLVKFPMQHLEKIDIDEQRPRILSCRDKNVPPAICPCKYNLFVYSSYSLYPQIQYNSFQQSANQNTMSSKDSNITLRNTICQY